MLETANNVEGVVDPVLGGQLRTRLRVQVRETVL